MYFLTNPTDPASVPTTPAHTPALASVDEETPLLFEFDASVGRRASLRPPIPVAAPPRALAHRASQGSLQRLPASQGGLLLISSTPSTPVLLPRNGGGGGGSARGRSDSAASASSPVLSPVSSRRM